MTFTFLQEELESILLFVTAPIYLTIVGLLQSKNIKILNSLKRKKKTEIEHNELKRTLKKIKYLTPLFMLIGLAVHITLYLVFSSKNIRIAYFISMSIMYIIYVLIAIINFYLKGAGVLKDVGNFNGLPGN